LSTSFLTLNKYIGQINGLGDHAVLTYTLPINGVLEEKKVVLPIVQYQYFEAKMVGGTGLELLIQA
jgi:hypothetical protein